MSGEMLERGRHLATHFQQRAHTQRMRVPLHTAPTIVTYWTHVHARTRTHARTHADTRAGRACPDTQSPPRILISLVLTAHLSRPRPSDWIMEGERKVGGEMKGGERKGERDKGQEKRGRKEREEERGREEFCAIMIIP